MAQEANTNDMEVDQGGYVPARHTCPHVLQSISIPDTFDGFPDLSLSTECNIDKCTHTESWVCTKCHAIFCGRYGNQHMMKHKNEQKTHCIAMGCSDLSFWCYDCDDYLHHLRIRRAFEFYKIAHVRKFNAEIHNLEQLVERTNFSKQDNLEKEQQESKQNDTAVAEPIWCKGTEMLTRKSQNKDAIEYNSDPEHKKRIASPVINDIKWNDNGKITLSFKFYPNHRQTILSYQLYYCYVRDNNTKWYQYVSNNWKSIHIASQENYNKDIELRISTCKDIYDENKNKNIELIMKIRCEFKLSSWKCHTFWSEFSEIYFIKSILIPNILNQHTQIDVILPVIFDDNNNENMKQEAKQKLISLYQSFKNVSGINNGITKTVIVHLSKYYQNKCKLLLSNNTFTFCEWLNQIEKCINYERIQLFDYIKNYSNNQYDLFDTIIKTITDELLDHTNHKVKMLIGSDDTGIIDLFRKRVIHKTTTDDMDRFLKLFNVLDGSKKCFFERCIGNIIPMLFVDQKKGKKDNVHNSKWKPLNISIFELHTNVLNMIQNQFSNNASYNSILQYALELYLNEPDNIFKFFDGLIDDTQSLIAIQNVGKLYQLYSSIPNAHNKIAEIMRGHLWIDGKTCMKKSQNLAENKSDDTEMEKTKHTVVCSLLKLHMTYSNIVREQFKNHIVYKKALRNAFDEIINQRKKDNVTTAFEDHSRYWSEKMRNHGFSDCYNSYHIGAFLASYANDLLTKASKITVASMDLDNTMDHIVMLYGYIYDKDIFERDFQCDLATRLLQNLSASDEAERLMINKLKTESGYHWTSKLGDMIKDIQRSKEYMIDFKKKYNYDSDKFIDFNVAVCTTGAWPSSFSSTFEGKVPHEIQIADTYKQFYLNIFSGRRLRYQMDKGTAELFVQFNATTKKRLVVSSYQMCVLLLFNKNTTLTFMEIMNALGVTKERLTDVVMSMAHPKVKILRKAPNTKALDESHKFQINPNYSNPKTRIIVPTFFKPKVNREVNQAIINLRKHQMQAAIKRIMCARKTLKHLDLVTEVRRQLIARFKPENEDIKKEINNMIAMEYLERDENDRQLYHYLS